MMYMKVAEFRKDLSKHMDAALQGEKIIIERGGVTYQLIAYIDEASTLPKNFNIAPVFESKKKLTQDQIRKEYTQPVVQYCPDHFQPKGQCLVKGCKYGR